MTTSTSPQDPGHADDDAFGPDDTTTPIRVSGPGALLGSIPALLGFVPEDSLVTVLFGGPRGNGVTAVARHDLADLHRHPTMSADMARQIMEAAGTEDVRAVLVAVIDSGWRFGGDDHWHRSMLDELAWLLEQQGTRVRAALLCGRISPNSPWISLLDDACGEIDDPRQSALAVAHVFQGRAIYGSREEMAQMLAPDRTADPQLVATIVEQVDAATGRARPPGEGSDRAAVERVCGQISSDTDPFRMSHAELARLTVDLLRADVRDSLLGLAVGPLATRAERFWAVATRRLPAPWRAETAALFAFTAYSRGEGPPAGIGVEVALAARSDHRLALLLAEALGRGVHPARIRELAQVGVECAEKLGARLP